MNYAFILLSYTSLFALGMTDNLRGPVFADIMRDLSLGDSAGSWFFAMTSGFGILGGMWAHRFVRLFGLVRTLQVALVLHFIALLILGMSKTFPTLLLGAAFFGYAVGLMGVAQNLLVMRGTEASRLQQMQSGLHSVYGFSSLLAPLLVAWLSQFVFSIPIWRMAFLVAMLTPLAVLLGSLRVHKVTFVDENEDSAVMSGDLKTRVLYFAGMLAAYVAAEILVSSRLALLVRRDLGASLSDSSYYVAGFFVLLLSGRLVFVWKKFDLDISKQLKISFIGSLVVLVLGQVVHPLFYVLSGLTMAPVYPMAMTLAAQKFRVGLNNAISLAISVSSMFIVSMHIAMGYLTEGFGIKKAFILGLALMAFALFSLVRMERETSLQRK